MLLLALLLLPAPCESAVDSVDAAYGAAVRQLAVPGGHGHNLYYDRDPWNAGSTRMVGIRTDADQRNWRVALYTGDGCYERDLFPIDRYDWRVVWDRQDPDVLYTRRASRLFRYNVATGEAELLKSFAPLGLKPNGPSLNQQGDRILVITSDGVFHSYRLPDMDEERAFAMEFPSGCAPAWDKPRYTGYRNEVFAHCAGETQAVLVYDDHGALVHRFEGVGGGGHHAFSPDGKWAWFRMAGRGTPLEIHVVNVDGADDRVVYSVPQPEARYVQNLHLAWPGNGEWLIASFFPSSGHLPATYAPPLDEILRINLDGTHQFLARTGTVYSSAGRRTGGPQDMFWAQPLARPNATGSCISFNSNASGTIAQYILFTTPAGCAQ